MHGIAHDKKQEAIHITKQQRKILIKIIIGAVLFAVGMVVTHLLTLPWWAELLIFLAVYRVPGFSVLEKAVRNIAHTGRYLMRIS